MTLLKQVGVKDEHNAILYHKCTKNEWNLFPTCVYCLFYGIETTKFPIKIWFSDKRTQKSKYRNSLETLGGGGCYITAVAPWKLCWDRFAPYACHPLCLSWPWSLLLLRTSCRRFQSRFWFDLPYSSLVLCGSLNDSSDWWLWCEPSSRPPVHHH